MSPRILLLGGITEALAIARQLGPEHIYSLAGIGRVPQDLTCQVRVGGYGGADGLAVYLREAQISLLIDATHPTPRKSATTQPRPHATRASPAGLCAARPGRRSLAMTGAKSLTGPD